MVKQSQRRTSQSMAATIKSKKTQPNKSKNTKQKVKSNTKPKLEPSQLRRATKPIRKAPRRSKVIAAKQQRLSIETRIACHD